MSTPSKAQERAIQTLDRNLVVMAGAGSGKTYVLVERFLNVLNERYVKPKTPTDWKLNSLVAITFTREASLEMRNRVRAQMLKRSQMTQNSQERERWSALLSQMDSARIGTIDGLCADILRQNAAEANIDPSFTILEEIEARFLRQQVVNDVLQQKMMDEAWVMFLDQYKADDIRATLQSESILKLVLPSLDERPTESIDWREVYRQAIEHYRNDLVHQLTIIQQPPLKNAMDDKLYPFYNLSKMCLPIILQTDDLEVSLDAFQQVMRATLPHKNVGKAEVWGDIKRVLLEIVEVLKDIHNAIGEATQEAMKWRWIELLEETRLAYDEAKRYLNAYDFGDLERKTLDLLDNHPSVRERYQGKEFKHIMVDEFQDTNRTQWRIVQHLTDISVGGSVFIVGDAKQSIYGFRNADVSVFNQVADQLNANFTGETVLLDDSYRTRPPLVDLLNVTFEHLLKIDSPDARVAQYQVAMQKMNAIRLPLLPELTGEFAPLEIIALDKQKIDEEKVDVEKANRIWEASEIATRIQAMVGQCHVGTKNDADKPSRLMQYNDVVILFRALSNIKLYEDALDALGIPFVTVAGRGFYDRQEVWDVLNFLRVMANPFDEIALMGVLRSPMFGLSDNALLALRWHNNQQAIWHTLEYAAQESITGIHDRDQRQVHFAWMVLSQLRQLAGRITIGELLRMILSKTGYLAMLTGLRGGTRLRRNVEKLVDIAEQNNRMTLSEFTRYVDELSDAEVREGEAPQDATGAVRLMSIHASKGLEFPVVFVADISNKGRVGTSELVLTDEEFGFSCLVRHPLNDEPYQCEPYKNTKEFRKQREEAESWRLLYVAATRVQDYLVLSGTFSITEKGTMSGTTSGKWMQALGTFCDLIGRYQNPQQNHNLLNGLPFRLNFPMFDKKILQKAFNKDEAQEFWDISAEYAENEFVPALLATPHIISDGALQHISATQLADLGGYRYTPHMRDYYKRALAMGVLEDAPARVSEAIRIRIPRVTRRIVGQVVHEALRHWQFPHNMTSDAFNEILKSYAWRFDLIDEQDVQDAVDSAKRILQGFQSSDVYQWIQTAREKKLPVYPELPFIYKTEKRILHGVMDLLFQNDQNQWVIVDFKTGYLEKPYAQSASEHTRQFYLQVGAYAEAVREQLGGTTPKVYIHYITYNQTVEVIPSAWQSELLQLEPIIGEIVSELYA